MGQCCSGTGQASTFHSKGSRTKGLKGEMIFEEDDELAPFKSHRASQYATWRTDKERVDGFSHELISNNFEQIAHKTDIEHPECLPHEGVDTILKGFQRIATKIPNANLFGTLNENNQYEWLTIKQTLERSEQISHGFRVLGLIPEVEGENEGEMMRFMGIQSKNRVEWALCHTANMFQKTTTVGLYDTLGQDASKYIIKQTELSTVCCSALVMKNLIELKKEDESEQMDSLKNIVVFEKDFPEECQTLADEAGLSIYTLDDVTKKGQEAMIAGDAKVIEAQYDDIYMLSYTSGTTGNPKGVKITHKMMVNCIESTIIKQSSFMTFDNKQSYISYLPFSHVMEQTAYAFSLIQGMQIGFYRGDVLKLFDDIQILKPTLILSVPRVLNKIYSKIKAGVDAATGTKKSLLDKALRTKLANLKAGKGMTHAVYDALIFKKFKAIFGGRCQTIMTGSAPIAAEVIDFLKVCFCVPVLEGYGMTETCGGACGVLNTETIPGVVGGPNACMKIKLRDIPEMGYLSTNIPPKGEICFSGPQITKGYYKNPEKTAEAFTEDGFLMSGDVGVVYPNGAIKIIDRAKNIFKLSQGEYIAPEKLENVYTQSNFVQQIWIYGDSLRDYILAFIVIEPTAVTSFCSENGCEFNDELMNNEDFKTLVIKDLMNYAKINKFNSLEKPKQYCLLKDMWTIESNMLTPTMKMKRNIAKEFYADKIEEMYEAGPIKLPQ